MGVTIEVSVKAPKRLTGKYTFNSFTELCEWIYENFKRPKSLAGSIIAQLSEHGIVRLATYHYFIEAQSSVTLSYPEHRSIAREAGVLRHKRGRLEAEWDFKDRERVLKFARMLDKKVK